MNQSVYYLLVLSLFLCAGGKGEIAVATATKQPLFLAHIAFDDGSHFLTRSG